MQALQESRPDLEVGRGCWCCSAACRARMHLRAEEWRGHGRCTSFDNPSSNVPLPVPPPVKTPAQIVLYAGGTTDPAALSALALQQFRLEVAPDFRVVPVPDRDALLPARHPRFTMAGQAAASVACAAACLAAHVPGVWLDTTGWAFPYPLVALAGTGVAAYVHYPTVSVDMLRRVAAREPGFNNGALAASRLGAPAKLAYYGAMAAAYAVAGCAASCAMANSSWTRRHVAAAWPRHRAPALVYPPCNTEALQELPLSRRLKRLFVVSVSQFRPEKQHALQARSGGAGFFGGD